MMALGTVSMVLVVAVFFASLVRTATGFGFALLAVPMMGLVLEPANAVGISLIFQIISGLPIALQGLSRWEAWYAFKLIGFALLGLLPGLMVLLILPPVFARFMLVLSLLIALAMIAGKVTFKAELSLQKWTVVGLCAGFMQGVAGASGPPILAALHADTRITIVSKRRIMSVFFIIAGLLALPPILLNMPETILDWELFGLLLSAMLLGILVGQRVFSLMSTVAFRQATVALLILSLALAGYPLISITLSLA
jgi:uncharacterized membrane protein YfcA